MTDNKKNQAIVLRSLLYCFAKQLPDKIYYYASNTGLVLKDLVEWENLKTATSKIVKEDIFLTGWVPKNHKKIDIYNNKLNPKLCHSVWLNEVEYNDFEEELKKDRDFGENSKWVMQQFPGENTFDAVIVLSEKVLYEKVIPKAIWNNFWKLKSGEIDESEAASSLNIGSFYVGLG